MDAQNTTITTEKLLETIGLQTVELNIHRNNVNHLVAENQQLRKKLADLQQPMCKPEAAPAQDA